MSEQSPLLRLPRELRDAIFRYTFDEFDLERLDINLNHDVEERKVTPPIESLPPICVVSKQLYDETTPYFLTRIMPISLNVATSCWLRKWLATFELGYRSIHQLSFRNFHGPEQIKGYELIVLCPNLRYLFVMIGNEHSDPGTVPSLAISSLSSSANAYESLDNIVLMHKLSQLVETPELQVLEFGFHDWEPMSHDRARQVKEWLSVKFRAKGKDVSIVCKQMQSGSSYEASGVDEISERWYFGRSTSGRGDLDTSVVAESGIPCLRK
jgi:hypothetical protein